MTFVLWVIGAAAFLWLGAVFGAFAGARLADILDDIKNRPE